MYIIQSAIVMYLSIVNATITYIVHYSRYKKENQIYRRSKEIEQRKESQNTHIKQGRTCDLTALTLNYLAASLA